MSSMKKILLTLLAALSFGSTGALAAGGGLAWDKFPMERVTDQAALQNGAKLFVNYCLNCHNAAFMRYNRLRDIGLTEEQIKANLIFTEAKVGDLMTVPLPAKQAKDWFGAVPPDLTVIARSRSAAGQGSGADYIYTLLRTYYRDDTKATGWNNAAFPAIGMPHPLWTLQGQTQAVWTDVKDPHDPTKVQHVFKGLEVTQPGQLSPREYDAAVADLVAYLQWMSEPMQNDRVRLGVWVMLFLSVFFVIAWRLNAAFWKDIK
jgi:ubiquinol-cytochrome c reductase cytochrome c1 subunit